MINTFVSAFEPFKSFSLVFPDWSTVEDLERECGERLPQGSGGVYLTFACGRRLPGGSTGLQSLGGDVSVRCNVRMSGGKGGFGSQLRAAGGRMARRRRDDENRESCRDLSGRRLRTIRQAKQLAEYLETQPRREREGAQERRAKLQAVVDAEPARKKIKFEDHGYLEQSEAIVEEMKSAVAEALRREALRRETRAEGEGCARVLCGWDE